MVFKFCVKILDNLNSTSAASARLGTIYKATLSLMLLSEIFLDNKLCIIANSAIVVLPEPVGVQSKKLSFFSSSFIPFICDVQARVLFSKKFKSTYKSNAFLPSSLTVFFLYLNPHS